MENIKNDIDTSEWLKKNLLELKKQKEASERLRREEEKAILEDRMNKRVTYLMKEGEVFIITTDENENRYSLNKTDIPKEDILKFLQETVDLINKRFVLGNVRLTEEELVKFNKIKMLKNIFSLDSIENTFTDFKDDGFHYYTLKEILSFCNFNRFAFKTITTMHKILDIENLSEKDRLNFNLIVNIIQNINSVNDTLEKRRLEV